MIEAAAIKVNDKVYTGYRHSNIIIEALNDNPDIGYITEGMYGFVTDSGDFVDRETAAKIAFECGQIKEVIPTLHSYDLKL